MANRRNKLKQEEPWKHKLLKALDNFKHKEQGTGREYMNSNYEIKD